MEKDVVEYPELNRSADESMTNEYVDSNDVLDDATFHEE